MKKILFLSSLFCCVLLFAADFEVVIPAKPLPVETFAADELKSVVEKATGKSGAVVNKASADAQLVFLLGRSAGLKTAGLPGNAFILRTDGRNVRIAGKDGRERMNLRRLTAYGTLYGVYEYLRRQYQVIWLWPGENGTYIPQGQKLAAGAYDMVWKPVLRHAAFRKFSLEWNRKVMRGAGPQPRAAGRDPGHAFGWWRKAFFDTNPEWFAARDAEGKNRYRTYSSMCVSNPEFHDKIIELWKATPHLAVNCRENDAYGNCACKNCKAWDGEDKRWPSAYYLSAHNAGERYGRFYRAVFDKARKINPEAEVFAYAYMNYVYAPRETKLHPDITIAFVDDLPFPRNERNRKLVYEEIDAWIASGASIVWRPNFTLAGYAMPLNYARQYADQFKRIYRSGRMRGLDFDGPNLSWATLGFNYYVMSRLTVEPDADVDKLEKEYVSAFGAGADDILAYLRYWERFTVDNAAKINHIYEHESARRGFMYGFQDTSVAHKMIPLSAYAPAEKLLLSAAAKCAGDKEALARVNFLLAGLRHSRLCLEACAVFADPQKDNPARMKMLDKVNEFRKNMPAGAADIKYYTQNGRLETHSWKLRSVDPANSFPLPEMWSADVVMKREELPEKSGNSKLSTWQFVDDQLFGGSWQFCRYRCTVKIPKRRDDERIILHLGAVDESLEVKVNGAPVASYTYDPVNFPNSWNQPMEFDISKFVKLDQENTIEVLVINEKGKGGLWRPSFIIYKPSYQGTLKSWNFKNGTRGWRMGSFKLADGALRVDGAPKLSPAKTGVLYDFPVAGRRFEIGATVRVNKFPAFLRLAIREIDTRGKTIGYRVIELNPKPGSRDRGLRKVSGIIRVRKEAAKIQLYIIPDWKIQSNGGHAEITEVFIGALAY